MAVPFSNTKIRIPRGFQNLLEGLAREVLRDQPKDVCAFAAVYFESLVNYRDKTGYDPMEQGARLQDRMINNKSFQEPGLQPGNVEQEDAALKIQTKYRQFSAKKEVEEMRQDQAALKIQAGYRGYRDRQKVKAVRESRGLTQTRAPLQQQEEEEDNYVDPEKIIAATKIQSGFRAYKARKETKHIKETAFLQKLDDEARQASANINTVEEKERAAIDMNDPETIEAALKIQAGLMGLKYRQEFADTQVVQDSEEVGASVDDTSAEQEHHDEQLELEHRDEQLELDAQMERAATKIQAGFRGMKGRHKAKAMRTAQSTDATKQPHLDKEVPHVEEDYKHVIKEEEEETGYDKLEDVAAAVETPRDVAAAEQLNEADATGTSLDAGADVETEPAENVTAGVKNSEETEIDYNDPVVQQATVKIQTAFRGYKNRSQLQQNKNSQQEQLASDKNSEEEQPPVDEIANKTVVETPADHPDETSRDLAGETPKDSIGDSLRDSVDETPRDQVGETPRDQVGETPRDLPDETPRDQVDENPRGQVDDIPRDQVDETPGNAVIETPRDPVSETPRDHSDETPTDPVGETPRELPDEARREDKDEE